MLGTTGLLVSEIGFGCWGIGGTAQGAVAYGPTNETQSLRALHYAFDRGINFFDTSDYYGFGHSEYLLGKAFKNMRTQVLIASKGGMTSNEDQQNFTPEYLRHSLEGTLRRLKTDYVDLYQLHSPDLEDLTRYSDILELFEKLQDEGKVRAFGISVRSPEDGLEVIRKFRVPCLQINFSLIDQRALDNSLLQLCADKQIGVIGRTPLCFGFLTGAYSGREVFPPNDHRSRWPKLQIEKWVSAHQNFVSLIPQTGGWGPSQFALQYCLSFAMVSTVIPGMLSEAHVHENSLASSCEPIPDEILKKIRNVYKKNRELLMVKA